MQAQALVPGYFPGRGRRTGPNHFLISFQESLDTNHFRDFEPKKGISNIRMNERTDERTSE